MSEVTPAEWKYDDETGLRLRYCGSSEKHKRHVHNLKDEGDFMCQGNPKKDPSRVRK